MEAGKGKFGAVLLEPFCVMQWHMFSFNMKYRKIPKISLSKYKPPKPVTQKTHH